MEKLAVELYKNNIIKFGDFKLKSGLKSPIYVNLKNVQSNYELFHDICLEMSKQIKTNHMDQFDIICGIPYGAISFAINVNCYYFKKPFIIIRKERKKYGMKSLIDGSYENGSKCLLIEDVVTTGGSVLETIKQLEANGIVVENIFVIFDRSQNGLENIRKKGYNVVALFSLKKVLLTLLNKDCIPSCTYNRVRDYIDNFSIIKKNIPMQINQYFTKSELAKTLYNIILSKETNVALSLDISNKIKFLEILEQCAPHICILKIHCDIIEEFDDIFISKVVELSKAHRFIIMEDRKFSDIGLTFKRQLCGGIYKINSWADCITIHAIAGRSLLDVYKDVNKNNPNKGVVIVSEMSNKNNLITENYTKECLKLGLEYSKNILGFVCQNRPVDEKFQSYFFMTPGVSLKMKQDKLDQKYRTPEDVIYKSNMDIIIVGRGIYMSDNPEETIIKYKNSGWESYKRKII